jgi:hypothetical protein
LASDDGTVMLPQQITAPSSRSAQRAGVGITAADLSEPADGWAVRHLPVVVIQNKTYC